MNGPSRITKNWRLVVSVDSVMLRPGYKIYLYEKPHWQGIVDEIEGKYQEKGEDDQKVMC